MSLIITRNFKRAKAQDAAAQDAQDAQGDEVIAQKNGYKLVHNTLNDGYWFYTKSGAGWGITATNKVAAVNEFNRLVGSAKDSAEFHVGQRVRAKDPRWAGYQGHALGNGVYTVKKVDRDGTVKLDGFLDVWISPSALVEANDACGKGEDAKNDFANRIMPLVRKIADAQKAESAADAAAMDAKFRIGDRVKCIKHTIMTGGRDAYGVVGRVETVETDIFGPKDPIYQVSIAGHNGTEIFSEEALTRA